MGTKVRRVFRWVVRAVLGLTLLAVLLAAAVVFTFRGSLPQLRGSARLAGLQAAVTVDRDALGVPTVRAGSRADAARATGFLHAQERFFQMDLSRRNAAGELAELVGKEVVSMDRRMRFHRLRGVARQVVEQLPAEHRELLRAYAEGVNAGLAALWVRPPEYVALRAAPRPWREEDSVLVVFSMYQALQDMEGWEETQQYVLQKALPAEALAFFVPAGTEWDAALDDSILPTPDIPGAEVLDFRESTNAAAATAEGHEPFADDPVLGSNNWAVDGRVSATGGAIVADDMHLELGLPNTWYRMRIVWPGAKTGETNEVVGVTLPGTPAVVVGSNRHIAWAFTNASIDNSDTVVLEVSPDNLRQYRTPEGWRSFETATETLHVRGGTNETLSIETTIWGPVLGTAPGLPRRALSWVGHRPEATNFRLLEMETAQDTETALRVAPTCGIPAQNCVVGDRHGKIGWTLMGRLPRRIGYSGRVPVSWADGARRWDGWLSVEEYPRFVAPPGGLIWTANNRVAGSDAYWRVGPTGVDLGARARQIRDDLRALPTGAATERDLLQIQLDDRAIFLERWQRLLLQVLSSPQLAEQADLRALRGAVEGWGGRAAVESAGYRMVRRYRARVMGYLSEPLTARCQRAVHGWGYNWSQSEQPLWRLLQDRPLHLLNPRFASYDDLLARAVEDLRSEIRESGGAVEWLTWGRRNQVQIQHPLSRAVPQLSRLLDIPRAPLPGDDNMPRVQGTRHGASERLVVSPGREETGLFHMPGGQSGHFLSPFYRSGHAAWAEGRPTPLLPGATEHRLVLKPKLKRK